MKVVGTNEEVGRFFNILLANEFPGFCVQNIRMPDGRMDRIHDGYIGKYYGVNIDIEIVDKPMTIGVIVPPTNRITNLTLIAEKHGSLSFAEGGIPNAVNKYKCKNGTSIFLYNSFAYLRGYKLDELWMESLPSNWDEFDWCILSVMGKRENIHFFKELKTNKEAE